jgi:hypothetical protein
MKALLSPDLTAGTYFMAAFLLRLPADMINHIISQDFKDCTKIAEYAEKLYARRRGNIAANYEATIIAIDRTSRWPEAIPITSITAADCARALSPAGYRDLESQPPSHQTEGPNSRLPYGRTCAACSTSNTHPRQPTTLNQTDWSSGSTGG